MRSPVMERRLRRMSREEQEACEQMQEEYKVDFDLEFLPMTDRLTLDGKDVDTSSGKSKLYGIRTENQGLDTIRMRVKADASEIAQIPVTIYVNGTLVSTVTLNGTKGQWTEITRSLGHFMNPNNDIRLYFAQSGLQIDEITIELEKEADPLAFDQ